MLQRMVAVVFKNSLVMVDSLLNGGLLALGKENSIIHTVWLLTQALSMYLIEIIIVFKCFLLKANSFRNGSSEGEFDNPEGIELDTSGYLYATDANNHRIQKFAAETDRLFINYLQLIWNIDDYCLCVHLQDFSSKRSVR
jgi:hypothetical protein